MTDLRSKSCQSCEGGVPPLSTAEIQRFLTVIDANWQLDNVKNTITRAFEFKNHYQVTAFVNAIAWISHKEDHHPDITFGYNNCSVSYITHAINGLSENDFICAAKVDGLLEL